MNLVIDSNNHHPITGAELKSSGAVALIAKATEGTSYEDPTLGSQRIAAEQAGVPFGSYLFLHPNSAGSEAAYYLSYAKPKVGDIQPVIDAEVTNLGLDELAKRVQSCAKALEAYDFDPILYCSAGIWKTLVLYEPTLKRLRIWEADYPGRFTRWFPWLAKLRIRLGYGATVVMWQWTDAYTVGNASFDASRIFVPVSSLCIGPKSCPATTGGGVARPQ